MKVVTLSKKVVTDDDRNLIATTLASSKKARYGNRILTQMGDIEKCSNAAEFEAILQRIVQYLFDNEAVVDNFFVAYSPVNKHYISIYNDFLFHFIETFIVCLGLLR